MLKTFETILLLNKEFMSEVFRSRVSNQQRGAVRVEVL
jgi:hypothetical protein